MDSLIGNKRTYCNIVEKSVDEEKRHITVIGSSLEVDRDNDVVDLKTMKIDNFKKNPVILWAHRQQDYPIAKAISIQKVNKNTQLKFKVEFPPVGISEDSDKVYNLIKAGFINATSIGFAVDRKSTTPSEERDYGYDFFNTELLELSFVPVPANASALVIQRSFLKAFEDNRLDQDSYNFLHKYFKAPDKDDLDELIADIKPESNETEDIVTDFDVEDFKEVLQSIQLDITEIKKKLLSKDVDNSYYDQVLSLDSLVGLDSDESKDSNDKKSNNTGLAKMYEYIQNKKSN